MRPEGAPEVPIPSPIAEFQELVVLAHLSLLAGLATREAAPGLHRGQKVCPTRAMF